MTSCLWVLDWIGCPSCSISLEMLDKVEPPTIPEGYTLSVAFSALLDLVRGITSMMEQELNQSEEDNGTHRGLDTAVCSEVAGEQESLVKEHEPANIFHLFKRNLVIFFLFIQ